MRPNIHRQEEVRHEGVGRLSTDERGPRRERWKTMCLYKEALCARRAYVAK